LSKPVLLTDRDYEAALVDAAESAERTLNDARMPIHILLSASFGELNDNQEEMLTAAATALERTAEELRSLRSLVDTSTVTKSDRTSIIRVADVLRCMQPELAAQASTNGVSFALKIEPALPAAIGMTAQVRDAIRLVLSDEIRFALPGTSVLAEARSTPRDIIIEAISGAPRSATVKLILADRLLRGQHGRLDHSDEGTTIVIPRAQPTR
jgi:hypothetical protein